MTITTLSNQFIKNAGCEGNSKKTNYFDTKTKGLTLEVRKSGGMTYYLRYSDERKKTRYTKLAAADDVTLSQARKLCEKKRNMIAMGIDPVKDAAQKRNILTFSNFIMEYYLPSVKATKRSWKTDDSLLRNHLMPIFGKKYLDEITHADVMKLQQKGLRDGHANGSINRRLILLRTVFNHAIKKYKFPYITSNPTCGISMLQENNNKERYITKEEFSRLYDSIETSQSPMLKFIIPFLVLTGARRNEVLHAKWEDFDIINTSWVIPITKLGKPRHVPLNNSAIHVLDLVNGMSKSKYVFGNPKTGLPYNQIWHAWDTARRKANLPNVRLHDLRHTFASLLINNGRTLYEVQKLLGHTQIKTTQRYAHLTKETLLEATNVGTQDFIPYVVTPQNMNVQITKAA